MWCHRSSTSCSGNAVTIPWRPAPWKILTVPRASWKRATTWRLTNQSIWRKRLGDTRVSASARGQTQTEAWKCMTKLLKSFRCLSLATPSPHIEQNGFPKAMVRVSQNHPMCLYCEMQTFHVEKDLSLPKDLVNGETPAPILPFIYLSRIPTPLRLRLPTWAKLSDYQVLSICKQNMQKDLESYLCGCWWNWKQKFGAALNHNQSDALPHQIHPDSARGSLELNGLFFSFSRLLSQKSEGWFLVIGVLLQKL